MRLSILAFALSCLSLFGATQASQAQAPQLLPYSVRLVAGGGTAAIPSGAICPASGNTSKDAYGDGCLATEIQLVAPRYGAADANGNIFFSDYTNGLIRRIDAATGIVSTIAGGASSNPSKNSVCGTGTATDTIGDGCPGTSVKLGKPGALLFDTTGNLYFSDPYNYNVRKLTAVSGVVSSSSIISLIAGNNGGASISYGFSSSNSTVTINAATQSYLDAPYGLALDSKGDLFITEEYKNAILVVNTSSSSNTVNGITIPAGAMTKIVGAYGTSNPPNATCPNGTSGTFGCSYNPYIEGNPANTNWLDSPYGVAVDTNGTVYIANEYNNVVPKVTSAGTMSTFAGNQNGYGKVTTIRATAGTFGIGSDFGIAADPANNIYITDAFNGVIWRVDGATQSMYAIAGAGTACTGATDTLGDGCPATQATFGKSGTTYAVAASPGIFGIATDSNSDLFVGDTLTNVVREVASGTQFGTVSNTSTVDTINVHFAAGDTYASFGAYTLTAGASNFSIGTPVVPCTTNNDNTTDCLVPIRATPSALGRFTGTLQILSAKGATSSIPLVGYFVQTPVTGTSVTYAASVTCTGTTTYSTATPINVTATVSTFGTSTPGGTVTFYANNGSTTTAIGTVQQLTNIGTTAAPIYGATLNYTFATPGTYTISANYSGDAYYKASTGADATKITSTTPTFTTAPLATQQNTVSAGQTGLYSFTITQSVYTGTLSFACSGLPSNSSCVFSPSSITGTGCSTTNTIAFSILTQQGQPLAAGLVSGSGPWGIVSLVGVFSMALLLDLRRRVVLRHRGLWLMLALLIASTGLMACGKGSTAGPTTPSGAYTVTVTTYGTNGTPSSFTVPFTVK
jgi:streptogramin lyase